MTGKIRFSPDFFNELGHWISTLGPAVEQAQVDALQRKESSEASPSKIALLTLAEEEYRNRGSRVSFLDRELFGEPAWDILLDLYIARLSSKRLPLTSLAIGSRVPYTTAHRWMVLLESRGLIERDHSGEDKRVKYVSLSNAGQVAMDRYFDQVWKSRASK